MPAALAIAGAAIATPAAASVMNAADRSRRRPDRSEVRIRPIISARPRAEFRKPSSSCHSVPRSEEHTSELQSLMRISYAVFCLKKKKNDAKKQAHAATPPRPPPHNNHTTHN